MGRRDRVFVAGVLAAIAVATPAIAVLARDGGTHRRASAACLEVAHAGVLGGGAYRFCGADRRPFCVRFAATDDAIAAACRRAGVLPGRTASVDAYEVDAP